MLPNNATSALVVFLMAIIIMMILPVPSFLLDIGLAFSFGIAVMIFTVTLFVQRPLDFSAFPAMLLGSLMLRLSLNVSSTKLILSEGHTGTGAAGSVIQGFASFIMGGSLLLGIITFLVILIVNFMVITKGAARMAEVGARFALDGMPGRQMAIDSDLAAGAITHEEARERRATEQAEAGFLGSLDGASKFVKGDAIAGLLITALNIVAGVLVGILAHGLSAGDAFEVYAILTIGDGLVTQIPAVIISIASGLLLARSGVDDRTDSALGRQIGQHPQALLLVGGILAVFAVFPGMPFLPFFLLCLACLGGYAFLRNRARNAPPGEAAETPPEPSPAQNLSDMLAVDDIHLTIAPNLISAVLDPVQGLEARIDGLRRHIVEEYGLIIPEVRITDDTALPMGGYEIRIQGVKTAQAQAMAHHLLVLHDTAQKPPPEGIEVAEPVFNAPAVWVPADKRAELEGQGTPTITPVEMISTHLLEVIRNSLQNLLTMRALNDLLQRLSHISDPQRAAENQALMSDVIPDRISKDLLLSVLKMLLEEGVTIRNLPGLIEATATAAQYEKAADGILEHVREQISAQILEKLKTETGALQIVQLDNEWERVFDKYTTTGAGAPSIALPPDLFQQLSNALADRVRELVEKGHSAVLVTSRLRRRFLFSVLKAKDVPISVLSYEEVAQHRNMALVGQIAPPERA